MIAVSSMRCMDIATGRDLERALGITHAEREKLVQCGLIAEMGTIGRATAYKQKSVEALAGLPQFDAPGRTLAVRLGAPHPADDEDPVTRTWRGWHERWDDATKAHAAAAWWQVHEPATVEHLAALVGPVVVGLWAVTGFTRDRRVVAFHVLPTQQRPRALLPLGRGPLTARL